MSFSIDTNVVLRLLVRDLELQYQLAVELIDSAKKPVSVADIVFIEIEYALSNHYGMNRNQVVDLLSGFIAHPKINSNDVLFTRVFDSYIEHPALSFTDVCLAVYATTANSKPLYTFDKKLAHQLSDVTLLKARA